MPSTLPIPPEACARARRFLPAARLALLANAPVDHRPSDLSSIRRQSDARSALARVTTATSPESES